MTGQGQQEGGRWRKKCLLKAHLVLGRFGSGFSHLVFLHSQSSQAQGKTPQRTFVGSLMSKWLASEAEEPGRQVLLGLRMWPECFLGHAQLTLLALHKVNGNTWRVTAEGAWLIQSPAMTLHAPQYRFSQSVFWVTVHLAPVEDTGLDFPGSSGYSPASEFLFRK